MLQMLLRLLPWSCHHLKYGWPMTKEGVTWVRCLECGDALEFDSLRWQRTGEVLEEDF